MTPEKAIQIVDEVLLAHAGNPLTDIQRLILRESIAGKGYEKMAGYAPQHIKNEGKKLWDLLSEALGEKVSKTNFKGALEKRFKSGAMVLNPPKPSNYDEQSWAGRDAVVSDLLTKLQGQTRLLWLTGISGIGKTALAECLASQAWKSKPSFQWIYLEILEGQSTDFASVATDLLAKLGDRNLDPQERNNPQQVAKRLLQKLLSHPYWIQLDALERLLNPEQPTEFVDVYWTTFLQRFLTESNTVSRLVLTAQALPAALVEFGDRYPNVWAEIRLGGLLEVGQRLEFFAKRGLVVEMPNRESLTRIAQIYEGHPLVLKVIAEDILKEFAGNVLHYWQVNKREFEQVARELQDAQLDEAEYNEALDRKVRERIKKSLEQLPADALDLLCRSSVFRRPVPKKFWLSMIGDRSTQKQKAAYRMLGDRALIELEGTHQAQLLIRQHNLIRSIAYDILKSNSDVWKTSEYVAIEKWLTVYEIAPNSPILETVRGHLEAFYHYYEIEDWEAANDLFMKTLNPPSKSQLFWLLHRWGYYQEEIKLCEALLNNARPSVKVVCYNAIGIAHYALSNYPKAISAYHNALRVASEIGDKRGESNAACNMGIVYKNLGDYKRAINSHEKDLAISLEIGDKWGEACALGNLGLTYNDMGEYDQAIKYHLQALETRQETNDKRGEAADLGNLGLAYYHIGEYDTAINYHQQCLKIVKELSCRRDECNTLSDIGIVYHALCNYEQALDYHNQALNMAVELNDLRAEGTALSDIGHTQIQLTEYEEALKNLNRALTIYQEIQARPKEAEVLKRLAELHQKLGKVEVARQYCQQALALAMELGIPLVAECEALQTKIENKKREVTAEE